jgi:hypothetical protein
MLIGLSSAFALFAAATAMHKRATDQSISAMMADSIFSEVLDNKPQPRGYEGYKYDLELVPLDENEDEIFVRISIRWLTQGRERSQVFSTILIRHIPFKGREPYSRNVE